MANPISRGLAPSKELLNSPNETILRCWTQVISRSKWIAIRNCMQFKWTHFFILESWEAMYRAMLSMFLDLTSSDHTHCTHNFVGGDSKVTVGSKRENNR